MRAPDEIRLPNFADQECPHGNLPEDKNSSCSCWDNFDLQCKLDTLRACRAPLPMSDGEAIQHALRLKRGGMSYQTISHVMSVYHGQFYSAGRWSRVCRDRGTEMDVRGLNTRGFKEAA